METKESFIFGLVYSILSISLIIIQIFNKPLLNTCFWIGLIIYVISGVIFISGNIIKNKQNIKKLIEYGIIIGVCSWIFIIISGIYGFSINNEVIKTWHLINTLETFNLINPVVDVNLPAYIVSEILYGQNISYVFFSIAIIILTVIGGALGVETFLKMRSKLIEEPLVI